MQEKFILVRKNRYVQTGKYPRLHVSAATYQTLAEWATMTDRPLSDLVGQCVEFAKRCSVVIEE